MPKQLNYLEEDLKKEISSKISRGKVEVYVTFQNYNAEQEEIIINKEIAKKYITQLQELAKETNISTDINIVDVTK